MSCHVAVNRKDIRPETSDGQVPAAAIETNIGSSQPRKEKLSISRSELAGEEQSPNDSRSDLVSHYVDSLLGASAIKGTDLRVIINSIFEEEYDPGNIKLRVQARQSRRTFNFEDENLGMRTDVAVRCFEVLQTFVAADAKTS